MFLSVLLLGAAALVVFRGWECKGFFFGFILGTLPFNHFDFQSWPLLSSPKYGVFILFGLIAALNAIPVWLSAWAMDKARIPRTFWLVLLIALIAGAVAGYWYQHGRFEDFKYMGLPRDEDPPRTRWDFYRVLVIPSILAFSMWGLYATAGIGLLASAAAAIRRRYVAPARRSEDPGATST